MDSNNIAFSTALLDWYDRHARVLPWRISPGDRKQGVLPDPYHVWLSEVMLQQTTVATVKNYFDKFVRLWPQIKDLASADIEDVMKAWAGLGYYSRARNLKACADIVARDMDGRFPERPEDLKKLPGIGDYTSAAIASIAFGQVAAVVDGNIERVVTRYLANPTPLPKVKKDCRVFMSDATPEDRPGDFVQAMMDLGATICTPKNPACSLCPVNADCLAGQQRSMLHFPVKLPKKRKPTRKGAVFVLQNSNGSIWLQKRANKGLLGGMTEVPTTDWLASKDGATGSDAAPVSTEWKKRELIRHTFTHFHLELEVWHGHVDTMTGDGWWSMPEELPTEALPSVFKKAIASALPDAFLPEPTSTSGNLHDTD